MSRVPRGPVGTLRARQLRQRPTDAESRLWSYLRNRGVSGAKFRRQHPIGPYVVDFLCVERQLVVELDGGQHVEQRAYDDRRTRFLEANGFRVMRFWNDDALRDTTLVIEQIALALEEPGGKVPSPRSSPARLRERMS